MKKIAVLLLLVLTIAGCGKTESGTITIKNNSTHNIKCGVGENWSVEYYSIASSGSKTVDWKNYVLVWSEEPKNIVTRNKIGDTVIFEDNTTPLHIVCITNKTTRSIPIRDKIKIYKGKDEQGNDKYDDMTCYVLADNAHNNGYVETLDIPPPPPPPTTPPHPPTPPEQKEYLFYGFLREENFKDPYNWVCTVSFTTDTVVRNGTQVTRQIIELK